MERLWRWRERTEGLGLVGLTHVDLGLDKRAAWLGWSERMVLDKGLSCSARDGWFSSCATAEGGGGALLDELQEMVSLFLIGSKRGEAEWGRRRWWEGRYGDNGVDRFVDVAMEMEMQINVC